MAETTVARRLYLACPVSLQNALVSLKGAQLHRLRYREPLYSRLCAELEESQWLTRAELQRLSLERLRRVVLWAYEQTEYYHELFDRVGFRPYSDWGPQEFRSVPLMSRDDIRKNGARMVARSVPQRKLLPCFTSGTTSSPLKIYLQSEHIVADWAQWTRFRKWCGFAVGEPRVTFNGRIFVHPDRTTPPFWRYNAAERQLLMSSFHVSRRTAQSYIDRINAYRPVHIDGYVSSLYTLTRFIHDSGASVHSPRSIATYSETLFPYQKETIRNAFRCPVHCQYGLSEGVCWAGECPDGSLHVSEEFGYFEIIKDNGTPAGEGEQGQIVGTSFHCLGMPLIRYATSDLAVASDVFCECGRGSRVVRSLEGRVLDIIVTPSGRQIPPTALTLLFDKAAVLNIRESQVAQTGPEQVVVRVVPESAFDAKDEAGIVDDLQRILGHEMAVRVELVQAIQRTKAGKFRFVAREWNG
ncbi:MAG: hypothetical protein AB1714_11005 [Acidobacteriota bacterium]